MRKLNLRKVQYVAQGLMASKWWNVDSNSGLFDPQVSPCSIFLKDRIMVSAASGAVPQYNKQTQVIEVGHVDYSVQLRWYKIVSKGAHPS